MTNEHIIPKWASAVLLERPGRPVGRFVTHKESTNVPGAREWPSARFIEHKFKVCSPCNESLARQIENPVRPIAEPMLRQAQLSMSLDAPAQLALARWLTKIALMLPFVNIPPGELRREDWSYLRSHSRPAPTCHVWIGAYSGTFPFDAVSWYADLGFVNGRSDVVYGVLMTLGLGHLVTQILIVPADRRIALPAAAIAFPPRFENHLSVIWPARTQSVTWPPARTFGVEELGWLRKGGEVNQRKPATPPTA
jgi:hypothetical protein